MFVPPTFKKIGKAVNDLHSQKFSYARLGKVRTSVDNDIQLTTTGKVGCDGDFSGSVHVQHKRKDIGTFKAELSTSGATEVTVEADKLFQGVVIRAVANDSPKGNADLEYSQDMLATTLNVECKKNTCVLGASGVIGFDGVSVGGEVKFDTKASELSDFNAGIEYTQSDFTGAVKTTNKADNVDVSFLVKPKSNPDLQVGVLTTYNFLNRNWKQSGVVAYALDAKTNVKAKADSDGMVAAMLEQTLANPNMMVRFSTEFNTKKHTTAPEKFGLSVFFGENFTEKD